MNSYSFQELQSILYDYARHGFNVLLEGTHGVGKSSLIEGVFQQMGWEYLILNTPTTDPYRDLCGIPEIVVKNKDGVSERVLLSVLPEKFAQDGIDALFLDEINRSSPEILNSLMELIQFKKAGGKKLNRLKVVWAAENPYNPKLEQHTQVYYVKPLDPAQKDRFHAFLTLRAEVSADFLKKKFQNETGSAPIVDAAVKWWNNLTEEYRQYCSPRRLEYALSVYFAMNRKEERLYDVLGDLEKALNSLIDDFKRVGEKSFQEREAREMQTLYRQCVQGGGNINQYVGMHNIHLFARLIVEGKIPQEKWLTVNRDVRNTLSRQNADLFAKVENGRPAPRTLENAIKEIIQRDSLQGMVELAKGSFTKILLEVLFLNEKEPFKDNDKKLLDLFIQYANLASLEKLFQAPFGHAEFDKLGKILNRMQQNALNILCFAMLCQNLDTHKYLWNYIQQAGAGGGIFIDRGKWFSAFWTVSAENLEKFLINKLLLPESEWMNKGKGAQEIIGEWDIRLPEQYRQEILREIPSV